MPLNTNEIKQIVDQMVRSQEDVFRTEFSLTRKIEGSPNHKEFERELTAAGFSVVRFEDLPKEEEQVRVGWNDYDVIVYCPVKAIFKFTPAVISNTPGFAEALSVKSKVILAIMTAEHDLGDEAVKNIARFVAMNPDNTIELEVGFHFLLQPSQKKPQKFIKALEAAGLKIEGEPNFDYNNALNSNAPDFKDPSRISIKVKYDKSQPDSRIGRALGEISGISHTFK